MSVQSFCFCQALSQAAIATAIFNNWQWKKAPRCFPSSIIAVFHTIGLFFLPHSEIIAPTIATEELAATVL
jgi:hypothetical protein